ncbi:glycosyltransferase [bacterium BMS3Abin03]|nr:glycosyltransferase [bacterium BMS3Abin03]MCG6961457.1 glycosyltransferase [bacterium BMS3Abin03]
MVSSNKKKIIIIGPSYPYRGGNSLFVTKTYEVLQNDFNVKIFNYKLLYPSLLFPGTTQFDKSEQKVFKVPSERIVNSLSPVNWFIVADRIKDEKPDLIIFDWWHPFFGFCHGAISFLLKKKFGKKFLFITENVVSHEANKIDKILTKIGIGNASMFLALSDKVVKELHRYSQNKKIYRSELPIYDCYEANDSEAVSILKSDLNIKEDYKVLLFFGYVRKYKGLDILLESFPGILEKQPDAFLLIVGEFYDNPDLYLNLIKKCNIANRVKIINEFVPNEEVYKYYQVSDVVVLPYKSATQSGILNIAYGFNKPVIVTDVGGLAEFVVDGKTGIIIEPNSTKEIVEGYDKLLNLQKKINFVENIRKRNTQNSFNKLPAVINQIIDEIEE